MTPDRSVAAIILTNYQPTITWTELIPTAPNYVKLLDALSLPGGVDIVVQQFIVGDTTPSGQATLFTGCNIGNQNINLPGQDIEGVRRIQINATSYTEL